MMRRQSASGNVVMRCDAAIPAALTRTSSGPNRSTVAATARAHARGVGDVAFDRDRTAAAMPRSRRPCRERDRGRRRSRLRCARRCATARPIPAPAPDTRATWRRRIVPSGRRYSAMKSTPADGDDRRGWPRKVISSVTRGSRATRAASTSTTTRRRARDKPSLGLAGAGDVDAAVGAAARARRDVERPARGQARPDPVPARRSARPTRRGSRDHRRARQRDAGERDATRHLRGAVGALLRGLVRQARRRGVAGTAPDCRTCGPNRTA